MVYLVNNTEWKSSNRVFTFGRSLTLWLDMFNIMNVLLVQHQLQNNAAEVLCLV